ncbi:type II secretion system protein [Actinoplanes regularis]|uniref:Type IV pilus assembly protein PilA n=1 Tax=Actinoplanes regularis TaxID=52697 RepID=A0A239BLW3_9ACTN|nr:prepilin-type N-terminal cleavage/methylation domain-containing protein [Actinoplanes regularis]GIE88083.1 hypothetical protein Are01nite_45630 [Actinoplanes regularis]SNS08391.1 type IV pilus assembly protein PilA [Actinoplanes regularis]
MQNVIDRLVAKQDEIRAKQDDKGFTLIELLVVVVIIGVLVAIAVPVYLNYRQGAADKSAQSDVRGAISAVEQYYTSNNNTFPATSSNFTSGGSSITLAKQTNGVDGTITVSDKTKLTYLLNADNSYTICAMNDGGTKGKVYVYKSASGGSVGVGDSTVKVTATGCS